MYKFLFQNRKAALAYAGITIISAMMTVGTDENGGMLSETVERLSESPKNAADDVSDAATTYSVGAAMPKPGPKPGAGWGSTQQPVFGDYVADEAVSKDNNVDRPAPSYPRASR